MKKVMSTCPGLNLVQSILAVWQHGRAKFSSSLVDIKICHNQCKLVLASRRRYFIGVIHHYIVNS